MAQTEATPKEKKEAERYLHALGRSDEEAAADAERIGHKKVLEARDKELNPLAVEAQEKAAADAARLKGLESENATLRQSVDALTAERDALQAKVEGLTKAH